MKNETRKLLDEAYKLCIANEKSLEFTIQYMQDFANVDLNCVLRYLQRNESFKLKTK